ncbi:MAG: hypothetical protein ACJ71K_16855 [Nitrososphaeraceae archaeon]|jgi:hypothetical protein
MQKQMIFIVTAVTLLTAVATAAVYTLKEANAQTNMTNNTGGNSTGIKVSKVTNPATGVTIGKIEQLNNTSSGGGNMTNATQ